MRKVVNKSVEGKTLYYCVSDKKYYGYKTEGGETGFISRDMYQKGLYRYRTLERLTSGNGHDIIGSETPKDGLDTLAEICKDAVTNGWEVYEFDSFKELLKWLIGDSVVDKKQVVNYDDCVYIDNVDPCKYYGVISKYNEKGFVTRAKYKSGNYIVLTLSYITYGNRFPDADDFKLCDLLLELINKNFTVFEFDTYKELFLWLLKDGVDPE